MEVNKFEDLVRVTIDHFVNISKEEERVSIVVVVKMTSFFPSLVNQDENVSLMEKVLKN